MEMNMILSIIVGLAVVMLLILGFGQMTDVYSKDIRFVPYSVYVDNIPTSDSIDLGDIDPNRITPYGYQYDEVKIKDLKIKYGGTLKESLDIVPVIVFKGISMRATVWEFGKDKLDTFGLTPDNPEADIMYFNISDFVADPPIRNEGYKDEMYETPDNSPLHLKETVLVKIRTDKGYTNFTVTLHDIYRPITSPFSCMANFEIECQQFRYYVDLYGGCLSEGEAMNDCQQDFQMCNSTVKLTANSLDCSKKTATFEIKIEAGNWPKAWEAGNKIGIAFFRKGPCTENFQDLETLKACSGKTGYLGGPYYFVKDP